MKRILFIFVVLVILTTIVPKITLVTAAPPDNNLLIEIIGFEINNIKLISNPGDPIAFSVKITNVGDDSVSWNSYPTEEVSWITGLTNYGVTNPGEFIQFNVVANPVHLGSLAVQWIITDGVQNTVISLNYHVYPPPSITSFSVDNPYITFYGEYLKLPINIPLSEYMIILKDPSGELLISTTCDSLGASCAFDQFTIGRPESYIGSVIFSGPHGADEFFINEINKIYLSLITK